MASSFSYWESKNFFTYNVIIIGSGIVGLTAALHLKKNAPNLSVSILERGFLPSGASTKNAGFACFGSVSELIEQERECGTDGLHRLIEKRWKGLLKLRKLLGDFSLGYQNYGGYEVFKSAEQELADICVSKIGHYNSLVKDIIKKENVFREAQNKISSFGFSNNIGCLIENISEAQIDTGKMMSALLSKAQKAGIVIFNSCNVHSIHEDLDKTVLSTDQGNFKAQKLLLCTNAFVRDLMPDIDVIPGRGQVMVTRPISNLKLRGTYHYDKGYYYFRNIGDRVLIGGGRNIDIEGEKTAEFGITRKIQLALEKMLEEIVLPGRDFKIEYRWSGIMAFGPQIAPVIKEIKPNLFCAVRCNGMGIAMGAQTGEDAANLVINSI